MAILLVNATPAASRSFWFTEGVMVDPYDKKTRQLPLSSRSRARLLDFLAYREWATFNHGPSINHYGKACLDGLGGLLGVW